MPSVQGYIMLIAVIVVLLPLLYPLDVLSLCSVFAHYVFSMMRTLVHTLEYCTRLANCCHKKYTLKANMQIITKYFALKFCLEKDQEL